MAAKLLKKTISTGTDLVVQVTKKRRDNHLIQYQEVDEAEGYDQDESREVLEGSTQQEQEEERKEGDREGSEEENSYYNESQFQAPSYLYSQYAPNDPDAMQDVELSDGGEDYQQAQKP